MTEPTFGDRMSALAKRTFSPKTQDDYDILWLAAMAFAFGLLIG